MKNKKMWFIALMLIILLFLIVITYLLFGRQKTFTLTFDTNGGSDISSIKVKSGKIVNLPTDSKKQGYIFVGWLNENDRVLTQKIVIVKDTTLRAFWIKNQSDKAIAKFNTDGGNEIDSYIMEKGNTILLPVDPVKKGYIFAGWMDQNGNLITDDMIVLSDLTLKARWIKKNSKTVTIKFNTDGGNSIKNIIVENGKVIVLPVNPTKKGYVFAGWVDQDGKPITKDTIISKDVTIKALWKEPYTCPSDCTPIEDGSKCTKVVTTNIINTNGCPTGYTLSNGKCLDFSSKYHALNAEEAPFWKCNNSSEYMYSEEDGNGGAFMWCVKQSNKVSTATCPSGYVKDNNTCKKTETINCTAN